MHRYLLLAAALAGSGLVAQSTPSVATGELTLNGRGVGVPSIAIAIVNPENGARLEIRASNNAGSPLLLVGGVPLVASLPLGTNSNGVNQSVDLNLSAPLQILLDGFNASSPVLAAFFSIPPSGRFELTSSTVVSTGLQAATANPAASAGIDLTQALFVVPVFSDTGCTAFGGIDTGVFANSSANVAFGAGTFTYYGVTYTDCWVNANGNVTFGASDGDFSPTAPEFLSGSPRIAPAWADFAPSSNSSVRYLEEADGMRIEWFDIRSYGCNFSDSNTFCMKLVYTDGSILMGFGILELCQGSTNLPLLTGISPGGGLSLPNNIDIGSGTFTGAAVNDALYEDFSLGAFSASFDLAGDLFTQTARNGVATPTGGNGVGPYSIMF